MRSSIFIVVVVTMVAFSANLFADKQTATGQYVVRLAMKEKTDNDEAGKVKELAAPSIVVKTNQEANVHVGGETTIGDDRVPFGTTVKVRVKPDGDGTVLISGVLELSTVGPSSETSVTRQSQSIYFHQSLALDKATKLALRKGGKPPAWLEITVSNYSP